MSPRHLGFARPLAIIVVAVGIAFLMIKSRSQPEARSVEIPLPSVSVQTVRRGTVPVSVVAHGKVTAWRALDLTAQLTGRVVWQSPAFEPGMVVAAGEPLLGIDSIDYDLALAEAEQALATAEIALADAKALRQTAREKEARATVAAAKARIARAQRDLENTVLVAPFSAVIDQQMVELGQFISSGMSVGRMLGTDKAEIRLPVPPQDIGFVTEPGTGTVTLSATVGSRELSWQGRLARVDARLDEQTRVFFVTVEVDSPLDRVLHGEPLPFGMFVRAEIRGGQLDDAVVLPQSALHGENDVFVLEEGGLSRRRVEVARIGEGKAYIVDGLQDGEQVVTTRLELMFEGMQVVRIDE